MSANKFSETERLAWIDKVAADHLLTAASIKVAVRMAAAARAGIGRQADLAVFLEISPRGLSNHLNELEQRGHIRRERVGRSVIYTPVTNSAE